MLHPRPQSSRENCTWHNFNVVPTKAGYYATVGSYQSGISVFDFSNPAAPKEIAYADPAPLQTDAAHHGHRPRRRLVDLLAQRHHLPVGHQARCPLLAAEPRRRRHGHAGQRAPGARSTRSRCRTRRRRRCRTRLTPTARRSTSRRPIEGAGFKVGAVADADFTCADDAGVESCVGSVANGAALDTAKLGNKTLHGHGHRHRRQHHDQDRRLQGQQRRLPGHGRHGGTVESVMGLSLPTATNVRRVHARRRQDVRGDGQRDDQLDRRRHDAQRLRPGDDEHRPPRQRHAARSPARCRSSAAARRRPRSPAATSVAPAAPTPIAVLRGSADQPRADAVLPAADRANETLRAGTYGKTLTFTMSTTTP